MRFLDTNVILRYLTRDDEAKAEACRVLLERVNAGAEQVMVSEAVFTELVYVLSSRRLPYQLARADILARLVPILAMRGLKLPHKRMYLRALEQTGGWRIAGDDLELFAGDRVVARFAVLP